MAKEHTWLFKRLGQRVREIRLTEGLTQQQLGERSNLAAKYVSEIERGLRNPALSTLHRVARAGLGITLAELMFRIDEQDHGASTASTGYDHQRDQQSTKNGTVKGEVAADGPPLSPHGVLDAVLAGRPHEERARLVEIFRQIADLLEPPVEVTARRARRKSTNYR